LGALYITSPESGNGKTTICAGLGKHLLDDGKKIGFFKPIVGSKPKDTDDDAAFMKGILALAEPVEQISPVFGNEDELKKGIKEAYGKISAGKDVVLIEGISDQGQAVGNIADALDARVIIVADYWAEIADNTKNYGQRLLGVILNKAPKNRLESVPQDTAARLAKEGTGVLGVLPEDTALLAPTIAELAGYINGEIVSNAEQSGGLVENLMLGAMSVDSGLDYFGSKDNKAAIIRGERPDMQMAALETSTRCLVLTGDTAPQPVVLSRAEDKNVPIILTADDNSTVADKIEDALGSTRFNQEGKLPRLDEVLEQHLDLAAVSRGLTG